MAIQSPAHPRLNAVALSPVDVHDKRSGTGPSDPSTDRQPSDAQVQDDAEETNPIGAEAARRARMVVILTVAVVGFALLVALWMYWLADLVVSGPARVS